MQRATTLLVIQGLANSVIGGAIHYYLWQRLVRAPELGPPWDRWGSYLFIGLALLIPVGLAAVRYLPRPGSVVAARVLYIWLGVAPILFSLLVASEVVRASILLAAPLEADQRALLSRAIAGVAVLGTLGLSGIGVVGALGRVAQKQVEVPLRRLPQELSGFRIVQISDLHVGPTLGARWLGEVVAQVNALAPDLVAITGDLVDGSVRELSEHVAPLAELRGRHGVFFVTGNHEYYAGADDWIAELTRLGVRVLQNEHVRIGDAGASFDLAGVHDYSAHRLHESHRADLGGALAGRDPGRELVLLAHQPKHIDEAEAAGVGLVLSGHTHGGQIFPWSLLVRLVQPYVAGLARQGSTHIYVSRGTGFWGPPMRVGAPSEISILELVRDVA